MKVAGVFLLLSLALFFYQGESSILLRSYFLSLLKLPGLPRGKVSVGRDQLVLGPCCGPGQGMLPWPMCFKPVPVCEQA